MDVETATDEATVTQTITVELPEALVRQLDEHVRQRGGDRSGVIREILLQNLDTAETVTPRGRPRPGMDFQERFAALQKGFEESGMSEEELDALIDAQVERARAELDARERRGGDDA